MAGNRALGLRLSAVCSLTHKHLPQIVGELPLYDSQLSLDTHPGNGRSSLDNRGAPRRQTSRASMPLSHIQISESGSAL